MISAYSNTAWEERIPEMKGLVRLYLSVKQAWNEAVPESERRFAFF